MSYSISLNNFKKVAAVATFIATTACLVPEAAQAQRFQGNRNPNTFGVDFELDTAITDKDGDSTNMSGEFPKAIRNFSVFNVNLKNDPNFNDDPTLLGTERKSLVLKVEPVQDRTIFWSEDFTSVGGSIYQYYFGVVPAIPETLDKRDTSCVDFDPDNDPDFCKFEGVESVSWLVPSQFTYSVGNKNFSIDLGDGSSLLANSLTGLENIFNTAATNGIETIIFPGGNIGVNIGVNNPVEFKTKVPDPGTLTGLLAFGFLGVMSLIKRKIQ